MWIRTITLLALTVLFMHASAASAFIYTISSQRSDSLTNPPAVDDRIRVDMKINDGTQEGVELFSAGLMYDPAVLEYEPAAPGASQPSYILYTPGSGATPTTYLAPLQDPSIEWNGTPTPGGPGGQVNVNWWEPNLGTTQGRATDVRIVTLQFKVLSVPAGVQSQRDMNDYFVPSMTANGNTLRVNGVNIQATARAQQVPEPAMIGLGLAAVTTLFGIRKARRQRRAR